MTRAEVRGGQDNETTYRQYCQATDRQWQRILESKTVEQFIERNQYYRAIMNDFRTTDN